ncbi:hypothetical protein ACOMICROBIO_LMKGKHOH_04046 [Vibrio sp. B1FIG11]|nr:hypothetical protein ACOMICROBIO_LMKGKHOH_04046 [Vibrio sp. B1FIG11]CAE6963368.1 hypothetical protein ACOMICROBIO_LMKGKHOH_04046 [Vibrio sp. B1FIG11]
MICQTVLKAINLTYLHLPECNLFPTNQKSQQFISAGKVFGLLGFLILFLVTHRCHGAPIGFLGKKTQHRALCAQEIGD